MRAGTSPRRRTRSAPPSADQEQGIVPRDQAGDGGRLAPLHRIEVVALIRPGDHRDLSVRRNTRPGHPIALGRDGARLFLFDPLHPEAYPATGLVGGEQNPAPVGKEGGQVDAEAGRRQGLRLARSDRIENDPLIRGFPDVESASRPSEERLKVISGTETHCGRAIGLAARRRRSRHRRLRHSLQKAAAGPSARKTSDERPVQPGKVPLLLRPRQQCRDSQPRLVLNHQHPAVLRSVLEGQTAGAFRPAPAPFRRASRRRAPG